MKWGYNDIEIMENLFGKRVMIVSTNGIVSNSDMFKNYRVCRAKAEALGKIFILKNNQPDAVLFSVAEYERLSAIIEYLEDLEDSEVLELIQSLPSRAIKRKRYSIGQLKKDIEDN